MPHPAITNLIVEDRVIEAIEAMEKAIELSGQTHLRNELLMQKGRYNRNEKDNRKGTIANADYRMVLGRVRAALLDYNEMINFPADFDPGIGSEDNSGSETGSDTDGKNLGGKSTGPKRILYLAASPKGETRIEGDKEYQRIKAAMERGRKRDNYLFLNPQFAVTGEELIRSMREKPQIIHFSVHGESEALIISDHDNNAQSLPQVALTRLLRPLQGITELVILNSCFSTHLAREVSKLGMYVTGNNFEILDTSSISFVSGLYSGLGEGKTYEEAYNDAMVLVGIRSPEEIHILEVWKDGEKLDI